MVWTQRGRHLRIFIQSVVFVLAAGLAILLSPPPPVTERNEVCADVETLAPHLHIIVNCDADTFVNLARDPSILLAKNSERQTRPGYPVMGHLLAAPFRRAGFSSGSEATITNAYYAGYVALNFLVLITVLAIFAELTSATSLLAAWSIIPVTVIALNYITKAFLWTAHQQIFALAVPVLSMWCARRWAMDDRGLTMRRALSIGFAAGVCSLIYGSFALIPATAAVATLLFRRKRPALLNIGLMLIITVTPFLIWRAVILHITGSFYSLEIQRYHQFVWMREQLARGPGSFANQFLRNVAAFLATVPEALFLPAAFLAASLGLSAQKNLRVMRAAASLSAFQAAIAFLAVSVPAYVLMGFYAPRLTAVLILPLAAITAAASNEVSTDAARSHRFFAEPATLAAIAYAALVILIPGPYA